MLPIVTFKSIWKYKLSDLGGKVSFENSRYYCVLVHAYITVPKDLSATHTSQKITVCVENRKYQTHATILEEVLTMSNAYGILEPILPQAILETYRSFFPECFPA